jgi:vacuolar protein sorting-associated protein 11
MEDMDLNFDVLTAIQALHSVGFDEHALKLAVSSDRHEEYLFISLTSAIVKDVNRALFYLVTIIPKIDIDELIYLITNFSSIFLSENPAAFTGLLIQLCTGTVNGQELKELFTTDDSPSSPHHQLYSNSLKSGNADDVNDDKLFLHVCQAMFEMPEIFPIEEALNVFADNDVYLRIFLEGVSDIKKKQILPPRVIELLLEVYLVELRHHREELDQLNTTKQPKNTAFVEISSTIKHLEDKILLVLDGAIASTVDYDLSQALLLMHSFQFESGELFLLEKMHSSDLILQKYIETGNEKGIMRVLRREGRKDPELYVQVLSYFVKLSMNHPSQSHHVHRDSDDEDLSDDSDDSDDNDDEKWDLICEVLALIEKERILTPMQVVPILSLNAELPLHIVSRFIKRNLQEACDDLSKLEHDVSTMRTIVQSVTQEKLVAKQLQESGGGDEDGGNRKKGGKSGSSVGHGAFTSYNEYGDDDDFEMQQAEAEREVEKRKWVNIKKAQMERTGDHESFFAELENSHDGYSTVAAYFGKTIISSS